MKFLKLAVLLVLVALSLTACGGGGGGGTTTNNNNNNNNTPTIPSAPAAVNAVADAAQLKISVSWSTVSGATSYNIYRATSASITTAVGGAVSVSADTNPLVYADTTNLAGNTTYYYIVTAVNSAGESVASTIATATTVQTLSAPAGILATPQSGSVKLDWRAVANATSYNVYATTNPSSWPAPVSVTDTGAATYTKTITATNGQTYYFKITAVKNAIESAPSNVISAIPSATPAPPAPTDVVAKSMSVGQVQLTWADLGNATYNVYRSQSPNVDIIAANKINTAPIAPPWSSAGVPSFVDQNVSSTGYPYYYRVTTVSGGQESTGSFEVTAVQALFTYQMVSSKTVTYTGGQYADSISMVCGAATSDDGGTVSYDATVAGAHTTGTGVWQTGGGVLTIYAPNLGTLKFNYEMMTISSSGAITVSFYYNDGTTYLLRDFGYIAIH